MSKNIKPKLITIDETSKHLDEVKELGRKNSSTLGFFPDGAFLDHAHKKRILGVTIGDEFAGYLLYRVSKNSVKIVHLCIKERFRGKNLSKVLIDHLKEETSMFRGISLRCRRDFPANKMWPKLGFTAVSEKAGRSFEQKTLTFWWLDHGHPNLFTFSVQKQAETKWTAVIDANIFFDLFSDESEESKALLADWLKDDLELCVAPEIFNDIDRSENSENRKKMKEAAKNFSTLPVSNDLITETQKNLKKYFPKDLTDSDHSDINHLSQAICSDADFFVTRDQVLLDNALKIKEEFPIEIVRPSDLIIKLDELLHLKNYYPSRLAGTSLSTKSITSGEQDSVFGEFRNPIGGETKSDFLQKLRKYLADPQTFRCSIVQDGLKPLAFFVLDRSEKNKLIIRFLRCKQNNLSLTLLRHLLFHFLKICVNEKRACLVISDNHLSGYVERELLKDKFIKHGPDWHKFLFDFIGDHKQINNKLKTLISSGVIDRKIFKDHISVLKRKNIFKDNRSINELQKLFWPLKIESKDSNIYLVPIRPRWAKDLFDENIASEDLFGAKKELALSREQVYYRSARPSGIKAPGGILWYVSEDKGYSGTSCIRAFSILDSVEISKPKDLFKKYERLGIYSWKDVFKTAKANIGNDIMAIKFSETELFKNPISMKDLSKILSRRGKGLLLQSPLKVTNDVFLEIYKLGCGE